VAAAEAESSIRTMSPTLSVWPTELPPVETVKVSCGIGFSPRPLTKNGIDVRLSTLKTSLCGPPVKKTARAPCNDTPWTVALWPTPGSASPWSMAMEMVPAPLVITRTVAATLMSSPACSVMLPPLACTLPVPLRMMS